jgi:diguanylate cyclase (GGDEF)-like protein
MYYSVIAAMALVVNLILNWETLRDYTFFKGERDEQTLVRHRYAQFLSATNGFYLIEILWGIFYGRHDNPAFFTLIYSVTVFYFIFIQLTMLTWARYMVAYLNKLGGARSKVLLSAVWGMFILGIVGLQFNRFFHFLFYYNESHEYIAGQGRYIIFTLQWVFYLVVSIYMLVIARRSSGCQKIRYTAVAVTSVIFGVSIFFQILTSFFPVYIIGLMVGTCMIHSYVEAGERKEKKIQDYIASVMAEDYEAIYYFDIESGEYLEFARSKEYEPLNFAKSGKNFYNDLLKNAEKKIYPEDKEYATSFFTKEAMKSNIEGKRAFSFKFRVMVKEEPRYYLFTYMEAGDGQHIILYEKDIEYELQVEKERSENQVKTVTFSQIAESLASNYDAIYYVNVEDSSFVGYEVNNIYGQLEVEEMGADFYNDCYENIPKLIHEQDQESLVEFINRDSLLTTLTTHKSTSINYRIITEGKSQYTRMTVRKSSDGSHFIIGVENINEEIQREKQHLKELKTEKELARRDELTGVKNKNAYKELEESIQGNMDNGIDYLPYGLIVCDANNLKKINDTMGHAAGDEYIKACAKLLCNIFVHSPVFRVGGDEFTVFLSGDDYYNKEELMDKLRNKVLENQKTGSGPVLASGVGIYQPGKDLIVNDVFERADKEMYENKQMLKGLK